MAKSKSKTNKEKHMKDKADTVIDNKIENNETVDMQVSLLEADVNVQSDQSLSIATDASNTTPSVEVATVETLTEVSVEMPIETTVEVSGNTLAEKAETETNVAVKEDSKTEQPAQQAVRKVINRVVSPPKKTGNGFRNFFK